MTLLKKLLLISIFLFCIIAVLFIVFKTYPVTISNTFMKARGYVPYKPLEANLVIFHPDIHLQRQPVSSQSGKPEYITKSNTSIIVIFMNNSDSDYNDVEIKLKIDTEMLNKVSYHKHGKYDFIPGGVTTPTELDYHFGPLKRGELRQAVFDFVANEPGTAKVKATITADKKITTETETEEIKAVSN